MRAHSWRLGVMAASLAACGTEAPAPAPAPEYLYLWTASADTTAPDFLAVLDVTPDSAGYGRLVTTVPVEGRGNVPHHSEHQLAADRQLFVNGFDTGRTWVFDLTAPAAPRVAAEFGDVHPYAHPHSYVRLPSGNVLATFQMQHGTDGVQPGGLVELTPAGEVVRTSSAVSPATHPGVRVYSAGVVPALDRIVTTSTSMTDDSPGARQVQVWRLSDLGLLHTFDLPAGPRGDEDDLHRPGVHHCHAALAVRHRGRSR